MTTPPLTKQNSSASIVVLTPGERNEAVLRHILADVCQLTECSSLRNFTGLIKRSPDKPANLILVRSLLLHKDSKLLKNIIKCTQHHTPILVLSDETDKTHIAEYMQSGARDTVSLDEIEHLRAVVERELEEHRMRCAYRRAASSAAMYREQVKRLTGQAFRISSPAANITTRVTDRENFIELLAKGLTRSPARGVRALALIRPDRFTAVQESVGFMASEEALVHIASVLTNLLHPADLCGRIGGTVFAVYIERGTMEDAEAWVRQVCRTLPECPFVNAGKTVLLTCTAGLCEITNSGESIDNIFQEAHKARARGRLQGEGRICLSTRSRATRSIRLRDKKWSDRILHAQRKNRIKLIHSPVVRLDGRDDKIRDTWVRMIDEKGNTILATEFVPVAKRLGLMTYIDRWVIAASMTYCTKRKPDLVFVRLSRNSMLDVSLAQWLEKIFRESTVKPEKICFQTTESVAARHMKQIIRQIDNIANLGVRFAIEQVGATPDTMKVLQFVPMQYARIDAALLQRVAWDKAVRHQVSKLVRATKARGVQVVADRIEDAATMAALCKMEVDFMQGDYVRRDFITLEDTMTVCRPMLRSA